MQLLYHLVSVDLLCTNSCRKHVQFQKVKVSFPTDFWIFWNRFYADFSHLRFIGQKLTNGDMSQTKLFPNYSDKKSTILMHKIPNSVDILIGSWNRRPSASWFIFNRLYFFWKCFKTGSLTKYCVHRSAVVLQRFLLHCFQVWNKTW